MGSCPSAKSIHEVGDTQMVTDLADDEFQGYLSSFTNWRADFNLPVIINSLRTVKPKDYAKWQKTKREDINPKPIQAFNYLSYKNKTVGEEYGKLRSAVTGLLHGPQGHINERLPFLIADRQVPECQPSPVLIKAVKNMRSFGSGLSRELALGTRDTFDEICAPTSVRDIAMGVFVSRGGDASIAFAESIRLLILASYKD